MRQTQLLKESSTSQASDVFSPRFILSKYKLEIPVCLGSRHLHLKAGTNSRYMTELVGWTLSSAAELHEISVGLQLQVAGEHFLPMDLFSSFDLGFEKGIARSTGCQGWWQGCNGGWLRGFKHRPSLALALLHQACVIFH